MIQTIIFSSIKGGVGKSVSSVNVAINMAIAMPQNDIILIDLDPQSNSSKYLGYTPDKLELSSVDLFDDPNITINDVKYKYEHEDIEGNLYVIPTDISLRTIRTRAVFKELDYEEYNTILKNKIDDYNRISKRNTIIIIDTKGGDATDILTINAMMCGERVICPVNPCEFTTEGLNFLSTDINYIREKYNRKLRLAGVVKTMWKQANHQATKNVDKELEPYKNLLYDTVIPSGIHVQKSIQERLPLSLSSSKNSPVSKAYEELSMEILTKWERIVR